LLLEHRLQLLAVLLNPVDHVFLALLRQLGLQLPVVQLVEELALAALSVLQDGLLALHLGPVALDLLQEADVGLDDLLHNAFAGDEVSHIASAEQHANEARIGVALRGPKPGGEDGRVAIQADLGGAQTPAGGRQLCGGLGEARLYAAGIPVQGIDAILDGTQVLPGTPLLLFRLPELVAHMG
jgi:hypothetical protein